MRWKVVEVDGDRWWMKDYGMLQLWLAELHRVGAKRTYHARVELTDDNTDKPACWIDTSFQIDNRIPLSARTTSYLNNAKKYAQRWLSDALYEGYLHVKKGKRWTIPQ